MFEAYLDAIALTERLHRQFLELVKIELDNNGMRDVNNVQAMILFNVGDLDMTVGELTLRGCYLGSNVSYNVKKMAENGYIVQERSPHDRRSIRVHLTEKGKALRDTLVKMLERHTTQLGSALDEPSIVQALTTLRRLERFWTQAVTLGPRMTELPPAA